MSRIAAAMAVGYCALAASLARAGDVRECWPLRGAERLRCYDAATGRPADDDAARADAAAGTVARGTAGGEAPRTTAGRMTGDLAERWAYDREPELLTVRQLNQNYVIARYSAAPNANPNAPDPQGNPVPATVPVDLQHPEVSFQLSGKVRVGYIAAPRLHERGELVNDAFGVWLAYTQRSHWQLFNGAQSRPFRETNYQPEAIVAIHPQLFVDDRGEHEWNWRLFNVGIGHQSNGQSSPLSRSWNYAFAQFGFETDNRLGQWSFVARPWYRLPEDAAKDDNPDLTDYLGYGDLRATWRRCDWELSLMARGNPATGKGAAQLDVSFPLPFITAQYPFVGYVQVFTGYGESLIDYNWRQTTGGIGVRLADRGTAGCPNR